jgi:hypothetical protein
LTTNNETPTAFPWNHGNVTCTGMTLRDYFAAKAMQSYVGDEPFGDACTFMGKDVNEEIARVAYKVADAMLKARGQA